jgi:prevent-host-death family protein
MDDISIDFAKAHLEDLVARARRGESVRIVAPGLGAVRVVSDGPAVRPKRVFGQWKDKMVVPARLMEPLTEDELRWLSGEDSP